MIDVEDFKLSVRLSFAPVKPHSCPGTDSESAHRSTQSHLLLGGGGRPHGASRGMGTERAAAEASNSGKFLCFYMEFTTKCVFK